MPANPAAPNASTHFELRSVLGALTRMPDWLTAAQVLSLGPVTAWDLQGGREKGSPALEGKKLTTLRPDGQHGFLYANPEIAKLVKARRKTLGDRYTVTAYEYAIARGCKKVGIPRWHPHQLRHAFATRVRRKYGIEVARILLGHHHLVATEVYAEADMAKANKVMASVG